MTDDRADQMREALRLLLAFPYSANARKAAEGALNEAEAAGRSGGIAGEMGTANLPANADADRALIGEVAMDIGKEAVSFLRVMYPDVYAAMNSGCRLGLRNKVRNEIMAALDTTDAEEIKRRLERRRSERRRAHAFWEDIRRENAARADSANSGELRAREGESR